MLSSNQKTLRKIGLILLPALLWAGIFLLRPVLYHPWCATHAALCSPNQVNALDRWAFHFGSIRADFWSTVVQNSVGVVAVLLPFLLYLGKEPIRALREDFRLLQITLWNGVSLELVRSLVQRPRPLVLRSPLIEGANLNQYTSFYSGHMSFVALATLTMYFMVVRRFPQQKWIQMNFFLFFLMATALTGALRVIGGRHYPTDVLCGFLVGCTWALFFQKKTSL